MNRAQAGALSVLSSGSGEPLVLLHPLALAGELWRPLTANLTGLEVFAVDLRGHGESAWDGKPFTIEDMADDLGRALDALGVGPINLLGMSMGGSVAMTFAGKNPDRVRSLVLADTTAWYGENARSAWAERADRAANVPRADQLAFQVDRWFSPEFREAHPEEVDRVCDIFVRTSSPAHAAASVAMGELDARPLLPSIRARTLVLAGEHDYATPVSMAENLAGTIPGAKLEVLPALRHLSLVEAPELAGRVQQYVREAR
jgi:3-oxoadipate enol-lactonase